MPGLRTGRARVRWLGDRSPMLHSVIRRSFYVALFFVAGHVFYYLLLLTANAKLDPVGFGRFYMGWATLNVLVAPGGVVTLSLSGHFADVFRVNGSGGVVPALGRAAAKMMPWALALIAGIEVLLFLSGRVIGADSVILIAVLPLTALTSVMVDAVRAVFQGMLRFFWFGTSWLVWCIVQFIFGAAGLVFIGAPWAVFVGMLAANCLTLISLLMIVWRMGTVRAGNDAGPAPNPEFVVQSLRQMLPLCTALGAFVLLSNADVIVAYLKFTGAGLGIYAASTVLPKAIVTATQPVAQVLLPLATHIGHNSLGIGRVVVKAVGTTFAMAALGAAALWLVSGEACGGHFGIKFCDSAILLPLAIAAVALSVIRTSIIADFLCARYWRSHLVVAVITIFAIVSLLVKLNGTGLALSYSIACWLLLSALALFRFIEWHRAGRWPLSPVPRP
jgi:O-antigen/teichoic acid export membrane protein